jgi:2,4-dienoyl-CoA reductase-like NADH-dependent reductase (Old Yellow Enzyme family)
MDALFSEGRIGTLRLANRMIRAAAHEGMADAGGAPTEEQARLYRGFVEGGIGLVITGYAGVAQEGKSALRHMTMMHRDDLVPAHRRVVDAVHASGGRIACQIAHCGRQTLSAATGEPLLVAPSSIADPFYREVPRALGQAEILGVVAAFAAAARRARDAGYDAVEVHAAHGYLLSTFLSRSANHRKDRWGGSLENRFRVVGAVLRAVRDAVGKAFPVLVKLNAFERHADGMRPAECVEVARLVEATGCCDAVEISAGSNADAFHMARGAFPIDAILEFMRPWCRRGPVAKAVLRSVVAPVMALRQPPFVEGYNLEAAARVKAAIRLPVITVGGMRSKAFMERAIREGRTDFVSLARPLLREPDLANRFRTGASEVAACESCNACFVAADTVPIRCHRAAAGATASVEA